MSRKVKYANQTRILGCGEHNSRDGGPCGLRHGGDAAGNGRRQACGAEGRSGTAETGRAGGYRSSCRMAPSSFKRKAMFPAA